MPKIFISFRTEDSLSEARNLYQSLKDTYGADNIFFFPESNSIGDRFKSKIDHALEAMDIFMPLIGPKFLTAADAKGNVRLFDPSDLVRLEIEYALKHNKIIIPIVIDKAPFPAVDQLPESLAELTELDIHTMSFYRGYEISIQLLINTINQKCGITSKPNRNNTPFMLGGVVLLIIAALSFWLVNKPNGDKSEIETADTTVVDQPPPIPYDTTPSTGQKAKDNKTSEISPSPKKTIPQSDFGLISFSQDKEGLISFQSMVNNHLKEKGYSTKPNFLDQSVADQNKSAIISFDRDFYTGSVEKNLKASCYIITDHSVTVKKKMVALLETVQLDFSGKITIINGKTGSKKTENITVTSSGANQSDAISDLENKIGKALKNINDGFSGCK